MNFFIKFLNMTKVWTIVRHSTPLERDLLGFYAIDMLLRWSKDPHSIGFRDAVNIADHTHIKWLLTPAA